MAEEAEWFLRFKQGDEKAFRQVFEKYYRAITYFASKILNDEGYAEDIVSETFRKAWEARTRLETQRHLENFLYLVTRNACISHLRSSRVTQSTDEEWGRLSKEEPKDQAIDLERVQARLMETILKKLEELPGGEVLRMSYIEGKSTTEIANKLEITENNVYIIKSRSLKVLRTMLSKRELMFFLLLWFSAGIIKL